MVGLALGTHGGSPGVGLGAGTHGWVTRWRLGWRSGTHGGSPGGGWVGRWDTRWVGLYTLLLLTAIPQRFRTFTLGHSQIHLVQLSRTDLQRFV